MSGLQAAAARRSGSCRWHTEVRGWCALVILLLAWLPAHAQLATDEIKLDAAGVSQAPIRVRVLLPPGYGKGTSRYPVLYLNDGQDLEAVGVEATLRALYCKDEIQPLIVVAIDMPPDRMGSYGVFDRAAHHSLPAQTKYGPVGLGAWAYTRWLTTALVPAIDARYRTQARADQRALAGWSLGALNAFAIGWQYPDVFGTVGAFSPSFWVSADRNDADAIQATRLVLRLVDASVPTLRPAIFLAVGTAEETNDRDADGVIDVIDDARDLLDGWQAPDGTQRKGLRQFGYSVASADAAHAPRDAAALYVLDGGQHNQASWARMMPVFLRWAYRAKVSTITADNFKRRTRVKRSH
jgi:predicted alpha/beta superfamily hydrolase